MNSFKALLSTHFLASPADILRSASRVPAPRTFVEQERVTHPYECQSGRERYTFLVKCRNINLTQEWHRIRNEITHLYSFFHVERCLGTRWLFSGYIYMLSKPSWILFPLTIKIFKDDEKLWANVTFPYKTLIRLLLVRFNVWVTAGTRNLWCHLCKGLIIGCKKRHAILHAVVSVTAKKRCERKNLLCQVFRPFK